MAAPRVFSGDGDGGTFVRRRGGVVVVVVVVVVVHNLRWVLQFMFLFLDS